MRFHAESLFYRKNESEARKMENRVTNIIRSGERRRFWSGIMALLFGVFACVFLLSQGMSRWWRLALLLPFLYAAFGVLQAREKT